MSPKEARNSLQNTNNRTETVKARIKATGEIIELNEKVSFLDYARGIYRDTDGNKYHYEELEIFEREYEKHMCYHWQCSNRRLRTEPSFSVGRGRVLELGSEGCSSV